MNSKGLVFMGMGFEMVGLVVASIWLGGVLDETLGWNGFGTAGMLILCLVGWIYHLIVLLQRLVKSEQADKSRDAH